MRTWLCLVLATGCSTASLRAGAVVVGGTPAFQASLAFGISGGSRRVYEMTHEHGIAAGRDGTHYITSANVAVLTLDDEDRPVARIGPRIRGNSDGASVGIRGGFFTGIASDPKTKSGGLGVELAGGVDVDKVLAVFEANIVFHSRWSIF